MWRISNISDDMYIEHIAIKQDLKGKRAKLDVHRTDNGSYTEARQERRKSNRRFGHQRPIFALKLKRYIYLAGNAEKV